jgi:enoyl-CoA hydratase/carnithine racemase
VTLPPVSRTPSWNGGSVSRSRRSSGVGSAFSSSPKTFPSADIVDAERARAVGLVKDVHEPESLVAAAQDLARSYVVGRSAAALAMARRLLYAGAGSAHPIEAHRRDSLAMWHASIGDGKEGVEAFLAKRDPVFTGTVASVPDLG